MIRVHTDYGRFDFDADNVRSSEELLIVRKGENEVAVFNSRAWQHAEELPKGEE